ncbi:MAG: precorrin-6A/cobalt-precorrin-6A reductase [Ruminococcus flavefaciens]|nr:precorrin-6A/cobalt-precorrin-6A reductase [Ruminococcus flavefaciens]
MSDIIIFGGTTEGRQLAEYCAENKIRADVCVTTDYGAELLPASLYINIMTGKLDLQQMSELISNSRYSYVIDATHPYATEATKNIKSACNGVGRYLRLLRESTVSAGTVAQDMDEIVNILNRSDKIILSTLGSKELLKLTEVKNFRERIWVRVLPADNIKTFCTGLGYDENKLILEKGPFTVEQNIHHINISRAEIMLTKESGTTGGYPEKVISCQKCMTDIVTLKRPAEKGYNIEEIKNIIGGVK